MCVSSLSSGLPPLPILQLSFLRPVRAAGVGAPMPRNRAARASVAAVEVQRQGAVALRPRSRLRAPAAASAGPKRRPAALPACSGGGGTFFPGVESRRWRDFRGASLGSSASEALGWVGRRAPGTRSQAASGRASFALARAARETLARSASQLCVVRRCRARRHRHGPGPRSRVAGRRLVVGALTRFRLVWQPRVQTCAWTGECEGGSSLPTTCGLRSGPPLVVGPRGDLSERAGAMPATRGQLLREKLEVLDHAALSTRLAPLAARGHLVATAAPAIAPTLERSSSALWPCTREQHRERRARSRPRSRSLLRAARRLLRDRLRH